MRVRYARACFGDQLRAGVVVNIDFWRLCKRLRISTTLAGFLDIYNPDSVMEPAAVGGWVGGVDFLKCLSTLIFCGHFAVRVIDHPAGFLGIYLPESEMESVAVGG